MSYLRIENNKIVEAPYSVSRNGKRIFGYNKANNEAMLFEDGYGKYEKHISCYEIKDNEIVEKQIEPVPQREVYTKLQIRRAMRNLGIENQLDNILQASPQFRNDWNDAQQIDLNDGMIANAIYEGYLTINMINAIKEEIRQDENSI